MRPCIGSFTFFGDAEERPYVTNQPTDGRSTNPHCCQGCTQSAGSKGQALVCASKLFVLPRYMSRKELGGRSSRRRTVPQEDGVNQLDLVEVVAKPKARQVDAHCPRRNAVKGAAACSQCRSRKRGLCRGCGPSCAQGMLALEGWYAG